MIDLSKIQKELKEELSKLTLTSKVVIPRREMEQRAYELFVKFLDTRNIDLIKLNNDQINDLFRIVEAEKDK